jgi:two-component system, cell cycle sensor histidine kinase and response regulator CckA
MEPASKDLFPLSESFAVAPYRCTQRGDERKFSYLSPLIHHVMGFPPDCFLNDPKMFFRIIHEEDRKRYFQAWEYPDGQGSQEVHVEFRILDRTGVGIWVQEHAVRSRSDLHDECECQGVFVRSFELSSLRSELRRWDRELQTLTENLPDWVMRLDGRLHILYLNRAWPGQTSIPPEHYLGKTIDDFGFPTEVSRVLTEKLTAVFVDFSPSTFEISYPRNQETAFYEFRLVPEEHGAGGTATILLICRDMTDVRVSQLAFRESEEKFRQLAETVDSVFWIWDGDLQQMVYVSPAYERLWGGDPQKLKDNPFAWLSLVVPEDRGRVDNLFLRRLDRKSLDIEYRILSKAGEVRWIHNQTFPLRETAAEARRIIGIAQDVTERKRWEEERLRSAKLESLGLLAGGLAHDFNNLLTAILGQVSLAKFGMDPANPLFPRLTEAENASLRAQEIAKQLLTFSKGASPVKKVIDLRDLIQENVRLVLAGSNVRPVFDLPDNLAPVNVDAGQISQVIHNLVINARQAMKEGGDCLVRAYNFTTDSLGDMELDGWDYENERGVRVDITDRGTGIPHEHLAKIFDPYFTTKSTGSGLGLATSYSIIRNHGGALCVTSEVNKGSTFSFLLPAVLATGVSSTPPDSELKKGEGEILIMDDETQIRRVLGEMVETCGYRCQMAKDGQEALQLFAEAQKRGAPFSAVILDLTVPGGIGGKEVIEELLRLDPQVKAIVVSGYSNDPVLAHFQKYGFVGRVAKPFNLLEISVALSSALHGSVE